MKRKLNMNDKVNAMVTATVPAPLCVSETALRQLRPLLEELIRRREKDA